MGAMEVGEIEVGELEEIWVENGVKTGSETGNNPTASFGAAQAVRNDIAVIRNNILFIFLYDCMYFLKKVDTLSINKVSPEF